MNLTIGFIGQGWIGKNYADNFEQRGFNVVRYSLDAEYNGNKEKIKNCDIVFIAVPTPTTPDGFDDIILKQVIKLVGQGKIAVIKSTILPGTTEALQKENPDIFVIHSPEFLSRNTAAYDAAYPVRNIIGLPVNSAEYRQMAEQVMSILPESSFKIICSAKEAELTKYCSNSFYYVKTVYFNLFYDLTLSLGCDWENLRKIIAADPWIGEMHINPVHKGGRGAGGGCLIKDYAAFMDLYENFVKDGRGLKILDCIKEKNIDLLISSNKDLGLLKEVYGEEIIKNK
jgi:UDPglucose 6-dehydrogenase